MVHLPTTFTLSMKGNMSCTSIALGGTVPFADQNVTVRMDASQHRIVGTVLEDAGQLAFGHMQRWLPQSVQVPRATLNHGHILGIHFPGVQSIVVPRNARQKIEIEFLFVE